MTAPGEHLTGASIAFPEKKIRTYEVAVRDGCIVLTSR